MTKNVELKTSIEEFQREAEQLSRKLNRLVGFFVSMRKPTERKIRTKTWHFLSIPAKVIFSNRSALKDLGLFFFFLEVSSITAALKFPQVGHLLF